MKKTLAILITSSILMLSSATVYADGQSSQVTQSIYKPGVTVTADENSPTGYTATFVYKSSDPDVQKIVLYSDTFMLWDEKAPQYTGSGSNGMNLNNVSGAYKDAYGHLPGDYKDTYWPGGGSASSKLSLELAKVPNTDVWYTQVPLMSGAFVYNYEVTKNGVTTARLDDPANPALVNTATGVRSLSSIVYVPYNAEKQGVGEYRDRSLELPRTDGRKGTIQTITYPASDGTNRGMTVYLPYGYDKNSQKPYNVLYINMGNSGDQFGNELRWMNEGALPNIADNLVAQGMEPFVAVSMNYQDWGHSWAKIEPDVLNYVMPFVESNYNVSKDRLGRGYAGLSAGAGTTARFYLNHPDVFSQFGIWSNGVVPTAEQLAKIKEYNDSTKVHIALGKWDYVTAGIPMHEALAENGIKHEFNVIPGGHDWEFWQLMFAEFAKDHLWKDTGDVWPNENAMPGKVNAASSAGTTANNTPVDVTTTQANVAVDAGVKAAKEAGLTSATVSLTRPGNVTLDTLRAMMARTGMPLNIHADTLSSNGKTVDAYITFDPARSVKDLNLFVSPSSSVANSLRAQFGRLFTNNLMVVSFGQEGEFGQLMEVAVKTDKKMNAGNAIVYSYNRENNTYAKMNTTVRIDDSGYIHFKTRVGGDIIISDGDLTNQ
ncbi:alpha/beta hydrolase [Paenibacillus chartarius]|uniref:Alpha/beta hydrolase n=1 Tax=Paenibacillus chartarius TaxID=747481 RepID=A0ABV6DSX6_9BACL